MAPVFKLGMSHNRGSRNFTFELNNKILGPLIFPEWFYSNPIVRNVARNQVPQLNSETEPLVHGPSIFKGLGVA